MDLIALSNLPWDSYFPPGVGPPLGAEARTHVASVADVAPWLEFPLRSSLEGEGVGGSPTNVALVFAGLGGRARVVGPAARDAWGGRVRAALAEAGATLLELTPPPPRQAQSLAFRDSTGERRFLATFPELGPATCLPPLDWRGPGWLVASSYEFRNPVFGALVLRAFSDARRAGRRTAFDLAGPQAVASARRELRALVEGGIDLLLAGTDALAALSEPDGEIGTTEILRGLAPVVVESRGPEGVRLVTTEGEWSLPALPGPVIDTTGAGDALLGGMLLALSLGSPPAAAVVSGMKLAAECLCHSGAHLPAERLAALRSRFRPGGGSEST